jgi:hypothetical protein
MKGKSFSTRVKTFAKNLGKKMSNFSSKRQAAKSKALNRKTKIAKQKIELYNTKAKAAKARKVFQQTKVERDAQMGGPRGYYARKLQTKIAKSNADVEMAKMKPSLAKKSAKTQLETDAKVKVTKARGAAVGSAVSALGAAATSKNIADSQTAQAKYKAEEETAKALTASLGTIPSVTTDPYSDQSVSGLVTGVR